MKPIDSTLTMIGPITGTSAMTPMSQTKAWETRPISTTPPASAWWSTLKWRPSHTSPPIANHSGSITFQLRHHGGPDRESTLRSIGSGTSKMGGCGFMTYRASVIREPPTINENSAAPYFDNVLHVLQARQQPRQLLQFLHTHGELHVGILAAAFGVDAQHVELVLGDDVRHIAQQALAVERLQLNIHFECGTGIEHPFRRHHARGIGAPERGAVGAVHGKPAPDRGIGDDGLGRLRLAAARKRQRHITQPGYGDRIARTGTRARLGGRHQRRGGLARFLQCVDQVALADVAAAERGEKFVDLAELEPLRELLLVRVHHPQALELPVQQGAAETDLLTDVALTEPGAHLGARTVGGQVAERRIEPVAARRTFLDRDDLNALAVVEHGVERHHRTVDLGAAAAMTQIGVHGISEVHRRGTAVERHHPSLRSQHVDLVLEQLGPELFGEFAAVGDVVLPLQDAPEPGDLFLVLRVLPASFLVAPVRGYAELRVAVHVEGADLHLERAVLGADHRGVQRTVVVALRLRDVVVELARDRLPQVVHQAQYRVAVDFVLHQHAHRADVVKLFET